MKFESILAGKNIYLDTSYSYGVMGKTAMERLIRKHGAEKILFGSDSPWG